VRSLRKASKQEQKARTKNLVATSDKVPIVQFVFDMPGVDY
jgi:hypothetical protein